MEIVLWHFYSISSVVAITLAALGIGIPSSGDSSGANEVVTSLTGMQLAFTASIASASPMIVSVIVDTLFSHNGSFFLSRLFGVLLIGVDVYVLATDAQMPNAGLRWAMFAIREVAFNCSLFATLAALVRMTSVSVRIGALQLIHLISAVLYFVLTSVASSYNAIALLPLLAAFIILPAFMWIRLSGLAREVAESRWVPVGASLLLLALRPLTYALRYSLPHVTALHPFEYIYIYSDCLLMAFLSVCPTWMQHIDDARKLRVQRVFVRHVSHEMRNPLNTVYIGLQLLADDFIVPYTLQMKQLLRQREEVVMRELEQQPSECSEMVLSSASASSAMPGIHTMHSNSSNNLEMVSDRHLFASTPPIDEDVTTCISPQTTACAMYPVAALHELTSNITASCETALDVLNELLLLDKISDSSMPLDLHVAPLLQFIRKTYRYMDIESRHKQIRLVKPDISLLNETHRRVMRHGSLLIDRNKVAKVYRNILSNALKFTSRGGTVSLALTLRDVAQRGGGRGVINEDDPATRAIVREAARRGYRLSHVVRYAVTDTGEDIAKLFKEFSQIDPSLNQGGQGTGLGLYISQRIVQLHGGNISVTSPGKHCGSTFVVELPVFLPEHKKDNSSSTSIRNDSELPRSNSQVDEEESVREFQTTRKILASPPAVCASPNGTAKKYLALSSAAVSPPSGSRCSKKNRLRRVLIVDDSNVTVKLMTSLMRSRADEIVGVTSGEKALQEVELSFVGGGSLESPARPFDCVFLDHHMSGLNGPDTATSLRKMGYRGLIIGLTGITEEADISNFKCCGADAVLGKPLSVSALDIVLEDAQNENSNRRPVDSVRVKVLQSGDTNNALNEAKGEQPQRSVRLEAFQKASAPSKGGSRIFPEHSPTADASWNMSSISMYQPDSSNRNPFRAPFV